MSSHPSGLRFSSPFASPAVVAQQQQQANSSNTTTASSSAIKGLQQKAQPQIATSSSALAGAKASNPDSINSGSSEEESAPMDDRYVLRQGPQQHSNNSNNNVVDLASGRYPVGNRSMSEARNPAYNPAIVPQKGSTNSNRNSLKETNSNRSSMDVSTSSYNTLIIHDDSLYNSGTAADLSSLLNSGSAKKDRPRSFGSDHQVIKEISEIPDDYLNQSSVLKQLVKEMKLPNHRSSSNTSGGGGMSDNGECNRPPPSYGQEKNKWRTGGLASKDEGKVTAAADRERVAEEDDEEEDDADDSGDQTGLSKLKSKSQPDLSRIIDIDLETIEALMKDNVLLKQQLNNCYMKVAKTKKLEEEVANIYRVHEELVQSCERREKLERAARTRLQSDLQRYQELNKSLKEEVDVYQSQLVSPSEHQILIAQLFQQNKELNAAKERQDIELAAQRATLQEQRKHIGILDKALQNAQHNMRCLEEEVRKKQTYLERVVQLQPHPMLSKQGSTGPDPNKLRIDYGESDVLSKDSNRSGSSTNSTSADKKWMAEKASQMMSRLESDCSKLEQRRMEEVAFRQNLAKSIEKTSQESDRMLAEAKQDKMRYLEELHSAQRQVTDLQHHLKDLEGHLVEKDALIRALQSPKACGSSFDSYNLSSDGYGLSPLVNNNNSQASFNVSNASFNLDHQNFGQPHHMSSSSSLLPNSDAVGNYGGASAYMRSGDIGANFISSKLTTNSPSSSPSLNYANQGVAYNLPSAYSNYVASGGGGGGGQLTAEQQLLLQAHRPSYSPKPSSAGNGGGGYENRGLTADQGSYNSLLQESNDRATQLGILTRKTMEDHLMKKQFDAQLNKRGLCCFPSLSGKKPSSQALLSDEGSVLSTNNSDAFLQNLALERQDKHKDSKSDEIVLLEKQGRCSQKTRTGGNFMQVTNLTAGKNMTDMTNIDIGTTASSNNVPTIVTTIMNPRGTSLPPRNLKPPMKKSDYGRLSDSERQQDEQRTIYSGTLRRKEEMHALPDFGLKEDMHLKSKFEKDYGTMNKEQSNFLQQIAAANNMSNMNYQRLEEPSPTKSIKKRSMLPKMTTPPSLRAARDSSRSNTNSRTSASPNLKSSGSSNVTQLSFQFPHHQHIPPKYVPIARTIQRSPSPAPSRHAHFILGGGGTPMMSPLLPHKSVSVDRQGPSSTPTRDLKGRGSSVTTSRNGENRYRIQF